MLKKLNYILSKRDKYKLVILLIVIVIGSFFELMGVAVFMPFITILMDAESILQNNILNFFYNFLNLQSIEGFLAILALLICAVYVVKNLYLIFMQNLILNFTYKMRMNLATRLLTTYLAEPYTFHLSKNVAELQ